MTYETPIASILRQNIGVVKGTGQVGGGGLLAEA